MLDSATIATAADENPAPGDSNASLVWIYAPWIGMLAAALGPLLW
jgi:hypothetical protein